jgi:hypothetical protein
MISQYQIQTVQFHFGALKDPPSSYTNTLAISLEHLHVANARRTEEGHDRFYLF